MINCHFIYTLYLRWTPTSCGVECRKNGDCLAYYYDSKKCFMANLDHISGLIAASPDSSSAKSIWLDDSHVIQQPVATTPNPDTLNATKNGMLIS